MEEEALLEPIDFGVSMLFRCSTTRKLELTAVIVVIVVVASCSSDGGSSGAGSNGTISASAGVDRGVDVGIDESVGGLVAIRGGVAKDAVSVS